MVAPKMPPAQAKCLREAAAHPEGRAVNSGVALRKALALQGWIDRNSWQITAAGRRAVTLADQERREELKARLYRQDIPFLPDAPYLDLLNLWEAHKAQKKVK